MPANAFIKRNLGMEEKFIVWIIGAFNVLVGFLLSALWQAVKDLQRDQKETVAKLSESEKLVVGEYLRRDEFAPMVAELFKRFDRLEDKVDRKPQR